MKHAIAELESAVQSCHYSIKRINDEWDTLDTSRATSTKEEIIAIQREKIAELETAIQVLKALTIE